MRAAGRVTSVCAAGRVTSVCRREGDKRVPQVCAPFVEAVPHPGDAAARGFLAAGGVTDCN